MVSDCKTFAHEGCTIAAQKKLVFSANLALLAGFFWYRCYYLHRSRDALSPICGIFDTIFEACYESSVYVLCGPYIPISQCIL